MFTAISFTLQEIGKAARHLLSSRGEAQVIALHGPMGTGKTTLIHACCDELGVTDAVGSPTYSIVNEYRSAKEGTVYHIDLYRLKDDEEARDAGIEDLLFSGQLCFVEWPEIAPGIFPDDTLHIRITALEDGTRTLAISG